ncbi:hypothetical protein D9M68_557310 [compost metagenome]
MISLGLCLHCKGQLVDGHGAVGAEAQATLNLERGASGLGRDADCDPDQALDEAGCCLTVERDGKELFPLRAFFLQLGDRILGTLQSIGPADMQDRLDQVVQQLIDRCLLIACGQKSSLGFDSLTQLLIVQVVVHRL